MPHPDDDPTIPDETILWRRVMPRWIVPDGGGGTRLSSAAFKDRTPGGMSAHIAAEADQEAVLEGFPDDSLVSFTAGQIRAQGEYAIRRAPTEEHPAHVLIYPKLSRSAGSAMYKLAQWVVRRG
jgi:hypothetical protein